MLSNVLSSLIFCQREGQQEQSCLHHLKKWKDVVAIIDYSEVFLEKPKNLKARAQTWSNYKHNSIYSKIFD